jgi:N-acetylmuramoyl-L-alanine amidase
VRIGDNGGETRVVMDLTEPVRFNVFVLPDPYRVVVDLPDMQWSVPAGAGSAGRGLVQGFRFGRFQAGAARIVLDVSGPVAVAKAFLIPPRNGAPNRLVIDLKSTDREGLLAARRRDQPPLATPVAVIAPAPPVQPKLPRLGNKKIVVIDPGHGGVDPGTIAADGTYEKHVTLQLAQELQRRLNQTGRYRVLMTRTDDSFIALRDRVQFAHDAGADLFISLHADSIHDKTIRGGTVYTLSQTASDKEAEELAADENKSDLIAGIDLSGENEQVTSILIDLAQRETMNHSATFAQVLVGELGQTVAMHRNGHRFAGFRVLKAPDVPSVLLEAGYLSNRQDEQMLRSPAGRTKLIDSVARALDRYFASAKG